MLLRISSKSWKYRDETEIAIVRDLYGLSYGWKDLKFFDSLKNPDSNTFD